MPRRKTRIFLAIVLLVVVFTAMTGCIEALSRYSMSVSAQGPGIVELYPERSWYWWGSVVNMMARPDTGAMFTGWTGDATGTNDQLVLSIHHNTSITANFAPAATCILSLEWDAPEDGATAERGTAPSFNNSKSKTKRVSDSDWKTIEWVNEASETLEHNIGSGIIVRYGSPAIVNSRAISVLPAYERIEVSDRPGELEALLESYRNRPDVLYAEPEKIWSAHSAPNDPYYSYQWNLHMLGMEAVWDIVKAESNIVVAVLDTGVWNALNDLSGTHFVPGYDFYNQDPLALDDNGHGSHVAGTIAQSTNNGIGVAGVAYGVSIMPVKVLGSTGQGTDSMIGQGIYYAVDHGARIINMSLGGDYSRFVEEACEYAKARGVLVIASAGNNGVDEVRYPAAYDSVLAVGAVDDSGNRTTYSNYGDNLDIMAPGGDNSRRIWNEVEQKEHSGGVLQQSVNAEGVGEYRYYAGTSMASPHVSAVAALLLSRNPGMDVEDVWSVLCNTASDDAIPGWDRDFGYGLLNPLSALGLVGFPAMTQDTAVCALVSGESLWWTFTVFASEVRASVKVTSSLYETDDVKLKLILVDDLGQILAESDPTPVGELLEVVHSVTGVKHLHVGVVVVDSSI